ncbi:hypothetical protein HDU83_007338 [Entophlyctis luteolus]|nr:hypothetical protein HDU83_007338 [Entophlyctis luteolus]
MDSPLVPLVNIKLDQPYSGHGTMSTMGSAKTLLRRHTPNSGILPSLQADFFINFLNPLNSPDYVSKELPSFLRDKLSASTFTARAKEMNQALDGAIFKDYSPVMRLVCVLLLVAWLAVIIVVAYIRFGSTWFAPPPGGNRNGGPGGPPPPQQTTEIAVLVVAALLGVIGILMVKRAFDKRPFVSTAHCFETLSALLGKYSLIDLPHGLVWRLHVTLLVRMPEYPTQAQINELWTLQKKDLETDTPTDFSTSLKPSWFGAHPARITAWVSVEMFDGIEVAVEGSRMHVRKSVFSENIEGGRQSPASDRGIQPSNISARHDGDEDSAAGVKFRVRDSVSGWIGDIKMATEGAEERPPSTDIGSVYESDHTDVNAPRAK